MWLAYRLQHIYTANSHSYYQLLPTDPRDVLTQCILGKWGRCLAADVLEANVLLAVFGQARKSTLAYNFAKYSLI